MMRKLIMAVSILALGLSTAANADEPAYTISCTGESEAIYTIDPENGHYAEIRDDVDVHDLRYEDSIILDSWFKYYEYAYTTITGGTYIYLTDLVVYDWVESKYGTNYTEVGRCERVDYIPIEH
jgi:hypothetical protein